MKEQKGAIPREKVGGGLLWLSKTEDGWLSWPLLVVPRIEGTMLNAMRSFPWLGLIGPFAVIAH